jgi:hypothetical protein
VGVGAAPAEYVEHVAGTVALVTSETVDQRAAAAARRGHLLGIKLRTLVREHLADESVREPSVFAPGAALIHGGEAWVLLDERPEQRLGAALAWAFRSGASALHVIADAGTGTLARRAGEFAYPVKVWHAEGRGLWTAVAEPVTPPVPVREQHQAFRPLIIEGGAEPVEEHGVLVGEVAGLEVCRVVDDAYLGTTRLEVGVGAHDREAFAMIHGDVPAVESLARIVAAVAEHRRPGALPHPLNRLAAERLLRARLIGEPGLVGAEVLAIAQPPVPRPNLKDPVPCVASGVDIDGGPIVVVCSSGVDLDVVPFAADAGLAAGGGRLLIALPARDLVNVTRELAALLRTSADLVAVA